MSRPTLVSFDVTDDWRRDQLRLLLREHGDWIQRSLWLLPHTGPTLHAELTKRVAGICRPGDRVLLHHPCPPCLGRIIVPSMLRALDDRSLWVG
jgi:CRISPR/Cas system-associated endoribonuclease Cas2